MERKGQSLIEVLVGIGLGALFIIAAAGLIAPALKTNLQVQQIQTKTALANEMLQNIKAWSAGSWGNVLQLATGSSYAYYLSTATSSFTLVAASSSTTSGTPASTVAVDSVGPNSGGTSVDLDTSLSWLHTVTSAATDTLLTVGVAVGANAFHGGHDTSGLSLAVTYNGTPMTSAGTALSANAHNGFVQLFYLIAPTSGTHTVLVTLSGGTADMEGGSVSFTGVSQVTPLQNIVTNTGSGTSASVVVTSASGDMVVDSMVGGSAISSSNKTLRWNNNQDGATAGGNGAQSTAAGAGSVTMGYTLASDGWGIVGADILADPGSAGSSGFSGTSTEPVGQNVSFATTTYNRYFYVNDVYRDTNGNITSTISGNFYDPSTKQVSVVVSVASSTLPSTTYTFYLTRNGNNIVNQTNWSGGSGQSSAVTLIGTSFANSANILISATGSIQLAGGGGACTL